MASDDLAISFQYSGPVTFPDRVDSSIEDLLLSRTVGVGGIYDECKKNMVFECSDVSGCTWRGGAEGCRTEEEPGERSNFSIVHALMLPLVSNMPEPPIPGGGGGHGVDEPLVDEPHRKRRSGRHTRSKHNRHKRSSDDRTPHTSSRTKRSTSRTSKRTSRTSSRTPRTSSRTPRTSSRDPSTSNRTPRTSSRTNRSSRGDKTKRSTR